MGVTEVRSLTGFPRRGKAAPFYPRQLTSKGASLRPQLSTPPHSILRVARACSCQSPPLCRMSVEWPDVSFFVVAVRLSLNCRSRVPVEPERSIFFSSSFSRRLFRSAGVEHPRMRNRPPHSVVPLLQGKSPHSDHPRPDRELISCWPAATGSS